MNVLVYSRTQGYRHEAIETGIQAIKALGEAHGFGVQATEDPDAFTDDRLAAFDVVIFLNTSGDVLDDQQQAVFERYIRSGGGFVGVHAAADTEYDWPWYGELVGAYFKNHPQQQAATLHVVDQDHPISAELPRVWERFDEWYNFRALPDDDVRVLVTIDESTYEGGENGDPHAMVWCHEYDGGRSFYTALGHTRESYAEVPFVKHLLEGIRWAGGQTD